MHRWLLILALCASSAFAVERPDASQVHEMCARFLIGTGNTLPENRARPEELVAWAGLPTAADLLQIFHDVKDLMQQARSFFFLWIHRTINSLRSCFGFAKF